MKIMLGTAYLSYNKRFDIDKKIYKFMSLKFLTDSIDNNYLYLNNITKWDDPWELPLSRVKCKKETYNKNFEFMKFDYSNVYATCFTEDYDTDAMWKIYSADKRSVCIETTARSIADVVFESSKHFFDAYFSPVLYANEDDIFKSIIDLKKEYGTHAYGAFIKRHAFEHEHEIRLATCFSPQDEYLTKGNIVCEEKGIKVKANMQEAISKFIFDPRITNSEGQELENKLGKYNIKMEKSRLYGDLDLSIDDIREEIKEEIYRPEQRLPNSKPFYEKLLKQ